MDGVELLIEVRSIFRQRHDRGGGRDLAAATVSNAIFRAKHGNEQTAMNVVNQGG